MNRTNKNGPVKISELFKKYQQKLVPPERIVINTFCEVVEDVVGITIDAKKVRYNPNTKILVFKQGGVIRSELLLKKKELLSHIKGRLGVNNAPKDMI